MAYTRELDRGEQIVIRKERTLVANGPIQVDHPTLGSLIITLIEKSGRRARIAIESDHDFYMEHVGAVKPKAS